MGLLQPAQGSPTPEGGSARPENGQKTKRLTFMKYNSYKILKNS